MSKGLSGGSKKTSQMGSEGGTGLSSPRRIGEARTRRIGVFGIVLANGLAELVNLGG
jgi:hypothetical protein